MKNIFAIISLLFLIIGFAYAQNAPDAINHANNRPKTQKPYPKQNSGGHYLGGQRPDSRKGTHYQNATGGKGYLGNEGKGGRKK